MLPVHTYPRHLPNPTKVTATGLYNDETEATRSTEADEQCEEHVWTMTGDSIRDRGALARKENLKEK